MFFASSDWPLKLGIFTPERTERLAPVTSKMASQFAAVTNVQTKKLFPKSTKKATKFVPVVFTGKALSV